MKRAFLNKVRAGASRVLGSDFRAEADENASLLYANVKRTYGDQKGQVGFLINNVFNYQSNGLPRGGYFVDLACADGVDINNTYFLEKYLEWDGLLFEPNPAFLESIRSKRRSKLVTECVTDKVGDTVKFRVDNGMLGGIVSAETDNNESLRSTELELADIVEKSTTTLAVELRKAGAPPLIDFMSLDIEGAEWLALRLFPFEEYKFRCIAIERPTRELDMLLDRNGYRQVAHLKYDVLYVHCSYMKEVNFSPDVMFAFTPVKDW